MLSLLFQLWSGCCYFTRYFYSSSVFLNQTMSSVWTQYVVWTVLSCPSLLCDVIFSLRNIHVRQ